MEALEGANTNTTVLQSMSEPAKALKKAHDKINVDELHDMMNDIEKQLDMAKEISEAISNPGAFGQEFDEDDLEELVREGELEEQRKLDKKFLDVGPSTSDLPEVPTASLSTPEAPTKAKKKEMTNEERELAEFAS